ncbi:hypothetical protein [Streptomyces sp. NBC_00140]|uniref:hypothetical protein n=1 Tax=Streptomyces sp. NBC_00140 TaxID=2975664 RepID=UPI0022591A70|nr:hypothetical protein [Streptomyces sp. NBC_00140]MCX5338248.1 hypothetical protein [Streptomyces sp. NBC_00140]
MVGAVDPAGASAAQVRVPVGARMVSEVANPVGVQLGGQLKTTAPEQQTAPERVVLVTAAEGIQLDRLQRQHQRLLRVRAAEHRRLDPPFVSPQ